MEKHQVIIIGGGLSGLTLAYLLEQKNYAITLIEASSRLGGRIQTVKGNLETPLELGATWFSEEHIQLLSLLAKLGLKKYEQYTKGVSLFQTNKFEAPQQFSVPEAENSSFRIVGGTARLIDRLKENLLQTKIILNTKVEGISIDQDELIIKTDQSTIRCAKAIICMPPQLAASIQLPNQIPTSLLALLPTVQTWMAGSIKFTMEYERPFWREKGFSGMLYSHVEIIAEMYDHTNFEENKFGFTGFLNSGYASFNQETRKSAVLSQLSKLFGQEALKPTAYFDKVWNDEYIIHDSKIVERPHQNNGHPLLQESYLDGKLFLSGTETSSQFAGYMEGAIRSAYNVAQKF